MPGTDAETKTLLGRLIKADDVEDAAAILSDAGYDLTLSAESPSGDVIADVTDGEEGEGTSGVVAVKDDDDDENPFAGKAKRKNGFGSLRDKMAEKYE